jgi:hypothetical protein
MQLKTYQLLKAEMDLSDHRSFQVVWILEEALVDGDIALSLISDCDEFNDVPEAIQRKITLARDLVFDLLNYTESDIIDEAVSTMRDLVSNPAFKNYLADFGFRVL